MNIFTFFLDVHSKIPLYEQLYDYIKNEIQKEQLKPNCKLPSKRKLATHLQVSLNTIAGAYDQLLSEGYIYALPKKGYYVAALEELLHLNTVEGIEEEKAVDASGPSEYVFSHEGVDLNHFPFKTWRKLSNEVIDEGDIDLVVQGSPQGDFKLRGAIAGYLHHGRGVFCKKEQIIISSGTEFLFQLLIQLLGKDNIFALENPGYEKFNLIFDSNDVSYVPIPVDGEGMVPEALEKSGGNVACVTPSHQFPTGVIYPIKRRLQLLNWAQEEEGRYIIEDDYDSEFKYSGKPIPALQGLDRGNKVIYIGSFSKSISPSIRISYMVLPEHLLKRYYEKLSFYICPVPIIQQKVLYAFIHDGHFEKHLNKMRNIYRKKRALFLSEIKANVPSIEVLGANAGLHLLLKVNNGMTEEELVDGAAKKGIKVYGLSNYYLKKPDFCETGVVVGYAAMTDKKIIEATKFLKEGWF